MPTPTTKQNKNNETAIDARNRRAQLKAQRNRLFNEYLKNPGNTLLALEIKAIDDQIAESMERSTTKRVSGK